MRALLLCGATATALMMLAGCDDAPVTPDGGGRDGGGDSGTTDGGRTDGAVDDGGARDGGPDAARPDAGPETCDTTLPALGTETVISSGLSRPVYVTQPPGVTDALYVVEKWGRIVIVRDGAVAGTFLDIRPAVCGSITCSLPSFNDERGLLGLAFHPNYAENGRFFVYFAPLVGGGRNVLQEFRRSAADPEQADTAPVGTPLIDVSDPASNHNGGMIEFGPDGYLYVAMGDGGGGCDTFGATGNGQNLGSMFGKLHRLDVDAAAPHAAAGNPFTEAGQQRTIWAYGLRNPWRFSFDRETGDLWIGDVGQNAYEEIDFQPRASTGGENYGWRVLEGLCSSRASGCSSPESGCLTAEQHRASGFEPPVFVVPHPPREGRSLVGGYVYRGAAIPALRGFYIFGDSIGTARTALRMCDGEVVGQEIAVLDDTPNFLVSFGEDNAGELYMVGHLGTILRIVPR